MKKAVLCFCHKKPEQVNILILQLLYQTEGQTDVFIHIDKNNGSIATKIIQTPNVFFIGNNVPIIWGDDSMVKAFVNSMNEIVNRKTKYDYFVVCTGQDLLVKGGLDEFLTKRCGDLFLDVKDRGIFQELMVTHSFPRFMCRDLGKKTNFKRIMRGAYVRLIRAGLVPTKKVNFDYKNIKFFYSFNWCAIPYDALEYIVLFLTDNPGFCDLYHNTYLPEDGFLGTILMNSKYRDRIHFTSIGRSETLTYLPEMKLSHVNILTMKDITSIEKSGCFFARKFDIDIDKNVIRYFASKIGGIEI